LGENDLDDVMIARISDSLKSHVRLHMLFLDNNKITEKGSSSLAECLKNK
jgi:Ran GTPase-activating protein (RanGAP) involved in mRNA processing and transport